MTTTIPQSRVFFPPWHGKQDRLGAGVYFHRSHHAWKRDYRQVHVQEAFKLQIQDVPDPELTLGPCGISKWPLATPSSTTPLLPLGGADEPRVLNPNYYLLHRCKLSSSQCH